MKSKKVTMLVAALAVAVVALAGIGYATVAYTATTSNSNNTVDVTYVQLNQVGDEAKYAQGSFIGKEYFNTETTWDMTTSAEKVKYTVTGETPTVTPATNVTAYVISNGKLSLKITDTEGAKYKLSISVSADMGGNSGIHYYFGMKDSSAAYNWSAAEGQYDSETGITTWTIDEVQSAQAGVTYEVVVAACGFTYTTPTDPAALTFTFVAESLAPAASP